MTLALKVKLLDCLCVCKSKPKKIIFLLNTKSLEIRFYGFENDLKDDFMILKKY